MKKITTKKSDVLKAKKQKKSVRLKTLMGSIQTVDPYSISLYSKSKRKKSKGETSGYRGMNASSASYYKKKKK